MYTEEAQCLRVSTFGLVAGGYADECVEEAVDCRKDHVEKITAEEQIRVLANETFATHVSTHRQVAG